MKVSASAISDRGLKRDGNEDQYLTDESLGMYVVCDGMGGHSAGEIAAEKAIAFSSKHISMNRDSLESARQKPGGYFRILKIAEEAVQLACQEVHRLSKSNPEYAGMGTTLTMLLIVDDKAIMAHVGDSRLYLMRDGGIHQLSVDHTLANELFLSGGLTQEEANNSQYQNVLTRSIGPHEFVKVDTLLFDLLPDDRMLLCSDGLSNYFNDEAIVAEFLAKPKIIATPDPLIEFAKQSGGSDNITAIVIETLEDEKASQVSDSLERMEAIKQNFLGRKLSVSRLMQLMTASKMVQCMAGKVLVAMGDNCPGMYIVLEGTFRVVDDDIIESELVTGDCFGAATLIATANSPASLIAKEPARVLLVERRKFDRLTRRMPRLGNALLRNLARHLSEQIVDAESARPIQLDDTGPLE